MDGTAIPGMDMTMTKMSMINSISNTMRTGNIVLDTLLLSMIPIAINMVFTYGKIGSNTIIEKISKFFTWLFTKKQPIPKEYKKLSISREEIYQSSITTSYGRSSTIGGSLNTEIFSSIIEKIQDKILAETKDVKIEFKLGSYHTDYECRRNKECEMIPSTQIPYTFEKQIIYIRYTKEISKNQKDDDDGSKELRVNTLTSMEILAEDLQVAKRFVDECYQEWCDKYKKPPKKNQPKFVYTLNQCFDTEKPPKFMEDKFASNKHFDCLFFPEKEVCLRSLNKFMKNPEYYQKKGIPLKESFLLHGEPGTGKTSFLKALANYFEDRHIFMLDLRKIYTDDALRKVFFTEQIFVTDSNGKDCLKLVPIDKRIYVIEEIDTMGEIVAKRSEKKKRVLEIDSDDEQEYEDKDDDSHLIKKMKTRLRHYINLHRHEKYSRGLSLYGLLNCLDGITELHGGLVVMTTNHPEKLDEALIREGRVNHKIFLTKMKRQQIKEMLEYHFDIPEDNGDYQQVSEEDIKQLPDKMLEPSKIEFMIRCCSSLKDAVEILKNVNSYNLLEKKDKN